MDGGSPMPPDAGAGAPASPPTVTPSAGRVPIDTQPFGDNTLENAFVINDSWQRGTAWVRLETDVDQAPELALIRGDLEFPVTAWAPQWPAESVYQVQFDARELLPGDRVRAGNATRLLHFYASTAFTGADKFSGSENVDGTENLTEFWRREEGIGSVGNSSVQAGRLVHRMTAVASDLSVDAEHRFRAGDAWPQGLTDFDAMAAGSSFLLYFDTRWVQHTDEPNGNPFSLWQLKPEDAPPLFSLEVHAQGEIRFVHHLVPPVSTSVATLTQNGHHEWLVSVRQDVTSGSFEFWTRTNGGGWREVTREEDTRTFPRDGTSPQSVKVGWSAPSGLDFDHVFQSRRYLIADGDYASVKEMQNLVEWLNSNGQ